MRLLCLLSLLCATAFGQSATQSSSGNLVATGPAAQVLQPSQLQPARSIQCLAPVETAVPTGEATLPCPKQFRLDENTFRGIPSLPRGATISRQTAQIDPLILRQTAQIDPLIVLHPPQSAIGALPPGKPVLPKIYPHLKMQLIHGDNQTASPFAPQENPQPLLAR